MCTGLSALVLPSLLFLVMQLYEIDVDTEFMKASDAACDVACLMYNVNDPKSFNYCASIYKVSGMTLRDSNHILA